MSDQLIGMFKDMTLAELTAFNRRFQDEFGVDVAPQPVQVETPPPDEPEQDEPTAFTVTLETVGSDKVRVIKVVRALTKLGLRESKDLVEAAPTQVLAGVDAETALAACVELAEHGAHATVTALTD